MLRRLWVELRMCRCVCSCQNVKNAWMLRKSIEWLFVWTAYSNMHRVFRRRKSHELLFVTGRPITHYTGMFFLCWSYSHCKQTSCEQGVKGFLITLLAVLTDTLTTRASCTDAMHFKTKGYYNNRKVMTHRSGLAQSCLVWFIAVMPRVRGALLAADTVWDFIWCTLDIPYFQVKRLPSLSLDPRSG